MIAFAPKYNTKGRKDATGAFIPEAKRFLEYHECDPGGINLIDNSKSTRSMRKQVLDVLRDVPDDTVRGVAFFCHGYRRGIQFGFNTLVCTELARELFRVGGDAVVVPLYACDTARDTDRQRKDDLASMGGDGGFADTLRDRLCQVGGWLCTVDAHTTAGHTTRNPHVRRFDGLGLPVGGAGGYYLVSRRHKPMWRAWRAALRTPFRFEFSFLHHEDIHAKLLEDIK
jgi:hypothetical protein